MGRTWRTRKCRFWGCHYVYNDKVAYREHLYDVHHNERILSVQEGRAIMAKRKQQEKSKGPADPSQGRGYSQMLRVSCEFAEYVRKEADRLDVSVIQLTRTLALEGGYAGG